jgi:mannose-6-phosphate isomerase-like protein (cupin superfamily)
MIAKIVGGTTLTQLRNSKLGTRKMLLAACGAIVLFSVVISAHAQTPPPPPPASGPGKAPHIGGNSFEGPKDVVYLPTRPLVDTRADMYFGDWHRSEPKAMFGTLVVRDILTPGDNFSPPYPGAVLERAKFLSYATLEAGSRTVPSTLQGLQVFFLVTQGEGEVSGGGKTEPIHKGSAVLLPEGLEFTLHNTGENPLAIYMVGDPTFPGFKPLTSFVVKDEANLPHSKPAEESPFTNPGAGGHWAHITHGFFNNRNGLATIGGIITVEILPMQLGEPHPHFPGHEEIWCEIVGNSVAFYGSQLRMQHPGQAYILRPDNLTTHSNINFEEPGDKPIEFLWFSTSNRVSTTPH